MNNILITGATGFVGMQVMKALDNLKNVNLFPIVRTKKKNIFKKFKNVKNIYFTKDIFNETERV